MARFNRRAIIIIKANELTGSRVLTKLADPEGGEKVFRPGLVVKGTRNPVTHHICSWQMTQSQYDSLFTEFKEGNGKRQAWMFDGDVYTAAQAASELNLVREKVGKETGA